MGRQHTEISLAVCNLISKNGSVNYLELEYALGVANGIDRLASLRRNGYVKPLPKDRCELKRYALTSDGQSLVAKHYEDQKQSDRNVMAFPKYVPPVAVPSRRGAMDAFSISSRGIGS